MSNARNASQKVRGAADIMGMRGACKGVVRVAVPDGAMLLGGGAGVLSPALAPTGSKQRRAAKRLVLFFKKENLLVILC